MCPLCKSDRRNDIDYAVDGESLTVCSNCGIVYDYFIVSGFKK